MFKKLLLLFLLWTVMEVPAYAALQANDDSLGALSTDYDNDTTNTSNAPSVSFFDNNVYLIAGDVTVPSGGDVNYNRDTDTEPSCIYPDDPKSKAPDWICNPSVVTGTLMTAVGSGKSFNPMLQRLKCEAMARLSMAQTLEINVEALFQQYAEMTGSGKPSDKMTNKAVTKHQVKVTLRGTSVKRTATSPKGTYYCLMVMEKEKYEAIADAAKEDARTSLGDKPTDFIAR